MGERVRTVALLAGIVLGACIEGGGGRPLGGPCDEDGSCPDPLVCGYGRCRSPCAFDRDCPEGQSCVPDPGPPGVLVCTLENEGCPGDLARDSGGLCRAACGESREPCVGSRSCVGGLCVEHDPEWVHLVAGSGSGSYAELYAGAVDGEGNLWVGGESTEDGRIDGIDVPGTGYLLLACFDDAGRLVFARRFGEGSAMSVALDGDRVFVAGLADGVVEFDRPLGSPGLRTIFVAALTREGEPLWSATYGQHERLGLAGLALSPRGELVLAATVAGEVDLGCGFVPAIGAVQEVLVASLAAEDGLCLWSRRFGGAENHQRVRGLAVDPAGRTVLIAGEYQTQDPARAFELGAFALGETGDNKGYLAVLSPEGEPVWAGSLRSNGETRLTAVVAGADGNAHVLGVFSGRLSGGWQGLRIPARGALQDVFVLSMDVESRALGWSQALGSDGEEWSAALARSADGRSVLFGGMVAGPASVGELSFDQAGDGSGDAFVAGLSAEDGLAVRVEVVGGVDDSAMFWELVAGPDGSVYALGSFAGEVSSGGRPLGTTAVRAGVIWRLPW